MMKPVDLKQFTIRTTPSVSFDEFVCCFGLLAWKNEIRQCVADYWGINTEPIHVSMYIHTINQAVSLLGTKCLAERMNEISRQWPHEIYVDL